MGFVACPFPGHSRSNSQSQESQYHLRSESLSGSISSQSSLPSVPSLTDSSHEVALSSPDFRCQYLTTLSAHSAYISSHAFVENSFLGGASDGKIRAWTCDPSGWSLGDDVVVACDGSAIKSMVECGEMLSLHTRMARFASADSIMVRGMVAAHTHRTSSWHRSLRSPAKIFSTRNYVQVWRNRSRTWVNHVDTVSSLALSKDGSLLYTEMWYRISKVWRTSDLGCLESVSEAHNDAINDIAVTSDGHRDDISLSRRGSNGVADVHIGRDDLRHKLMQKNASRQVLNVERRTEMDLRETPAKTVHSSTKLLDTPRHMLERKDSSYVARIPPSRVISELAHTDSLGRSSYAYRSMDSDNVRQRSPERLADVSRALPPPRSREDMHRLPAMRSSDDARSIAYMRKNVLESPRPASTNAVYLRNPTHPTLNTRSPQPVLGQPPPPPAAVVQRSSFMIDEHQTVDGLLQALGLGKYSVQG